MKTDEQFHRAKSIFLRACDLETSARAEMVDAACGDDENLKREVESLLRHDPMPTMPKSGPADSDATVRDDDGPRRRGPLERVGPYRIIGEIQRGGMGVVYLATREDGRFKRRAAVKVIKRGMDTEEVLRRFELERQVLAALNHPNIARLFDGGETDDGRPYFAMEYVDGLPIDQYCDKHRLRIGERLRLFEQVCRAVHYAHQNLVVHRDLKPGNIMVTENGSPKLLDFGIAKIINAEMPLVLSDPTAPQLRVMTPEYASPEQVRGDPIGTASDVYSLGVLLYELVTGHRPYHIRTRMQDEIVRVVCEEDPDRPSTKITESEEAGEPTDHGTSTQTITPDTVSKLRETRPARLRKSLAGDVDNIVMKALRKETQRRYASAEQFAEDIRYHLCGLPVIARKDSFGYRTAKFVLRHRAGVSVAALLLLTLTIGTITTTLGWQKAHAQEQIALTERDRAEAYFDQVRSIAHTFMYDFHDAIEKLDGSLAARALLVEAALAYLDGLREEGIDHPELAIEVANAYDQIGDIRGGRSNQSYGDLRGAIESYETARAVRAPLLTGPNVADDVLWRAATNHRRIGRVQQRLGDVDTAAGEFASMMVIARELASRSSAQKTRRRLGIALHTRATYFDQIGEYESALADHREVLAIRRRLVVESPEKTTYRRDLSVALIAMAGSLDDRGDHAGAIDHLDESVRNRAAIYQNGPNARSRRDLAIAEGLLGHLLLDQGRIADAAPHIMRALTLIQESVAKSDDDARLPSDLVQALTRAGRLHAAREEWNESLAMLEESRSRAELLVGRFDDDLRCRIDLANAFLILGQVHAAMDKTDWARARWRDSVTHWEIAVSMSPEDDTARHGLETALGELDAMADAGE